MDEDVLKCVSVKLERELYHFVRNQPVSTSEYLRGLVVDDYSKHCKNAVYKAVNQFNYDIEGIHKQVDALRLKGVKGCSYE